MSILHPSRFYIDLRKGSTMEFAHSVYQQSLWSSYHARYVLKLSPIAREWG